MPEVYKKDASKGWPWRGILLFVLPFPLVAVAVKAFAAGADSRLIFALAALACLWSAALLNRSGLRAEAEFRRRKIATAPRTPRKTLAAILVGLGTFLTTAYLLPRGILIGALAGVLASAGAVLAYGTDPRGEKGAKSGHGYSTEEIVEALGEAETKINAIDEAARKIHNHELGSRLRAITHKAREILKVIEQDPGDLRRARKFLNVYLDGAQAVTSGYAKTHLEVQSDELERNFRNVLDTIESSFSETRERLLEDDVMDLDVQIEVLNTQLKREGVL